MSNKKELALVDAEVLTTEEKTELNAEIDRFIEAHKANRKEINRLVFESVAAMTEADEAGAKLSNKGFFRRMVGGLTGSNQKLQNKINQRRAAAQYASQQTLQKLAEQNLMSFDLITAVNNKLNASMRSVGEGFQLIFTGLEKFFKHSRNEMVRLEMRMDKVERNVKLLTWQNSIEYLEFNGEEYTEMDDVKKIVCLVRDFYDITKGEYSTSDLLLLKAAMSSIDMDPKSQVNYGRVLESIGEDDALKNKLLGGNRIQPAFAPGYLIAMSGLQKMDALRNEERYTVDTIADYVSKYDSTITAEIISRNLTFNYLKNAAGVDVDTELDSFDMVLDLLYNLKEADEEHLLVSPEEVMSVLSESDKNMEAEGIVKIEKDPKLQSAKDLFLDYKLEDAHTLFKELAESGSSHAMYFLGEYCIHGYVPEAADEIKANEWWERGVEAGDALSAIRYAASLPNSSGKRKEILSKLTAKALALAESGDPIAQWEAAKMYEKGLGVNIDKGKMLDLMSKSADAGYWLSKYEIGTYYADGIGVEKNDEEAFSWYNQAAFDGYDVAQVKLGDCYYYGIGVEKNYLEAVEWYQKASEQKNAIAMLQMGECYYYGYGVDQEYKTAVEWYQKSANLGNGSAYNRLGYCYYQGTGVAQSYKMAAKFYKKAIELGNVEAETGMALCYEHDYTFCFNNIETALKWYRKAAEDGNGLAQYLLGTKYAKGWGPLFSNEKEAIKWFKMAADQENIDALCELAKRYEFGNGVKKNIEEAIKYYQKASDKGDEDARAKLLSLQK